MNEPLFDLVVLARVLDRGSFARAAKDFAVPPSTLSRKIAALEKRIGARTLERTTRSLRPTELGEQLAERGRRLRAELELADQLVADFQHAPRGTLRLSVPTPTASDFLGDAIADYLRRYADMKIEVIATDRIVDLVREGFDAAIRIGRPTEASLGTTRLGAVAPVLAATRAYLDRAPALDHPRDLAAHSVIAFGPKRRATWTFVGRNKTEDVEIAARAAVTSVALVAELVASGAGISLLPRTVAKRRDIMVIEPGGMRPKAFDFSIVTPSVRSSAPKVRAFVDLMRAFVASRGDLFD